MSFYLTLPSSVRFAATENKLCDYTTELPTNIELDGTWEVGLAEVAFTRSWFNVTSDQLIGIQDIRGRIYAKHPLRAGYYQTIELLNLINECLRRHVINNLDIVKDSREDIKTMLENNSERGVISQLADTLIPETPYLFINKNAHRAEFKLGKTADGAPILPYMDDDLAAMLGFDFHQSLRENYITGGLAANFDPQTNAFTPLFHIKANRAYDIERGIAAIYIYSDIVKPQFIGDVKAPCLSVCLIPSTVRYGQNCTLSFSSPNYVPVASRMFRTIRISLKDKSNTYIPFEFGETIVKLLFRLKNAI